MRKALYGILVVEWLAPHEPYLSIGNYLDDPQKGQRSYEWNYETVK